MESSGVLPDCFVNALPLSPPSWPRRGRDGGSEGKPRPNDPGLTQRTVGEPTPHRSETSSVLHQTSPLRQRQRSEGNR
ncbi:hypothetical protein ACOMHN_047820 [Nucella lapillus]